MTDATASFSYEQLMDHSGSPMVILDRNQHVVRLNTAAFDYLSALRLQVPSVGHSFEEIVPAFWLPGWAKIWAKVNVNLPQRFIESFLTPNQNKTFNALVTSTPLNNANGELEAVLLQFVDLSGTEETEGQIGRWAKETGTVTQLLDRLPLSMLLFNEDFKLARWLGKPATSMDIDLQDHMSQSPDTLLIPRVIERMLGRLDSENPDAFVVMDAHAVRRDGTQFPVELGLHHLGYGNAKWVVFLQDITDRRRLEAELLLSQKMEAIGMLTNGVAHDLNNLLTVILGHLDLGRMDLEPGHVVHEEFDGIQAAVDRACAMTLKLLAFARTQVIEPQLIDFVEVVTQVRPLLERTLEETISLNIELQPSVPLVEVDLVQMEQLILNLVINARDAIGIEAGKIDVKVGNVLVQEERETRSGVMPAGEYLCVEVIDDGEGVEPHLTDKIFEPFFTTKTEDRGTGLGLSTCMRIVEQNRGWLEMESTTGQGTSFRVYFEALGPSDLMDANSSLPSHTTMGQERIVFVEDDRALRVAVKRMLERCGYEVYEARHGEEAIEFMKMYGSKIDLVITDVIMPELGGVGLAHWLVTHVADVPVIFISGYADEVLTTRGLTASNTHFLRKPFSTHRLVQMIDEVLHAHAQV